MLSSKVSCISAARLQCTGYRVTALIGLILAATLFAFGQGTGTATIVGTVTDSSGAVLPNVAITCTHVETGETRTSVTNDTGLYVLPSLAIGHYNVTVQATGFGGATKSGIELAVDDRARVDFVLKVGATQENITIEANAVAVQTDTGEVSGVINGEDLTQLATNGRSIYGLVNLTPGVANIQGDFIAPTSITGDQNVSINGSRPINNLYMIDGGEDNDRGGGGYDVLPSLDSIAEFRTLTSNYSAEYGLTAGGVITQVFKSGTQQFHASAWEFLRNDALDARGYFNPAPQKVTELRFNTYGFNAGGQVPLWKSHPTFFFYNMEWRSLINGGSLNQNFPASSSYGGDFTALNTPLAVTNLHAPAACQLSTAQQAKFAAAGQALSGCTAGAADPALEVPFVFKGATNVINPALIDSNATTLLGAGIFPSTDNSGVFHGGANSPTNVREEIVRIDHTFSSKFSVFGHFVAEQATIGFGTTQWSGDNSPSVGDTMGNPSYSAVVHTTYVINPTLLNEAAFNYNGNRINIIPKGTFAAPSAFAFNRIFTGPNILNRIPSINLGGAPGAGGNYTSNWTPWTNVANGYQFKDDVSWTKGTHQLKMGASWALWKKAQSIFTTTQGNFDFSAAAYTGNGFSDFLLGYAGGYSEDAVHDSGQYNNVSWAAYIQDNWRVNRRLTLNLGLRWDGAPHTYEANDRLGNFYANLYNPADAAILASGNSSIDPSSPGLGTSPNSILAGTPIYLNGVGIPGKNGVPKDVVNNHWAAFGPRIGFAYDPSGAGKMVVRGGFGINYSRIQGNDMYNAGGNSPFNATDGLSNVLLSNPKTSIATNSTLTAPIPVVDLTGMDINNYKLPLTYQYSLGVQQALGAKTVFSVAYVGNQSRHLNDYRQANLPALSLLPGLVSSNNAGNAYNADLPYLGFRSLRMSEDEANASYNSLQANLHATVRKDLTFQFGYTYSKAIDPTTNNGSGSDLSNVSDPYVGWRYDNGPSIYDRTHVAFVNFVYTLPIFNNTSSRLLKSTLGGWQLSGIVTAETGAPVNLVLGGTSAGTIVQQAANRPNVNGPIATPHTVTEWFDPSAFSTPAPGTWGDAGHNAIRGPGRDDWNLSLFKTFAFTERFHFEFRAESFNTWNHTQFRGDQANGSQGNGIDTNTTDGRFGQVTAAYDPREFQFGAKLIF
jgi:hypothetical protein